MNHTRTTQKPMVIDDWSLTCAFVQVQLADSTETNSAEEDVESSPYTVSSQRSQAPLDLNKY